MTRRATLALFLCIFAFAAGADDRPGMMGFRFTCDRPEGQPSGWLTVRGVTPDYPADRAGLRPGDRIVELNGRRIEFTDDLDVFLVLLTVKPDQKTPLTILRDGKEQRLELLPTAMPNEVWEQWKANLDMLRAAREQRMAQKQ
jgi:S1-C subfamily serine protease